MIIVVSCNKAEQDDWNIGIKDSFIKVKSPDVSFSWDGETNHVEVPSTGASFMIEQCVADGEEPLYKPFYLRSISICDTCCYIKEQPKMGIMINDLYIYQYGEGDSLRITIGQNVTNRDRHIICKCEMQLFYTYIDIVQKCP